MSKTSLRKELETMSAEQLRQMILDAYAARPEIKEYFEFFLNPDVEKLLSSQLRVVDRELARIKWGRSRARVTVLKKCIKNVMSLKPGPETDMRMLYNVLIRIAGINGYVDLTPAQENFSVWLAQEILALGDREQMADKAHRMLDDFIADGTYRLAFRRFVAQNIGKL